jgi:Arc/MetJ-type ribon-helix-helix transcriptional regulator
MNLAIESNLKRLIDQRVKSGKYATPQDVVTAAILSLDQQERLGDFKRGELDELLAEGERSIARDGTLDGNKAFQARRRRRAAMRNKRR